MGTASFGNLRFNWVKAPSTIGGRLEDLADRMPDELLERMTGTADDIRAWMRTNHPWTNRTRATEQALRADARMSGTSVSIVAAHGVRWGGFLETGTSHHRPFPVLKPGLEAHYAAVRSIMDDVARLNY
jgi:hypothetical protein